MDDISDRYLRRHEANSLDEFRRWMYSPTNAEASASMTPDGLRQRVMDVAAQHGVDPALGLALVEQESNFNPRATSKAGAQGLMQLMPATAKRFGVSDAYDVEQNLQGGFRYLSWLQQRFPNDPVKVLASYNAGEGAVAYYGGVPPYQETQNYVRRILGKMGQGQAGEPLFMGAMPQAGPPTGRLTVPTGEPDIGTGPDVGQRIGRQRGAPLPQAPEEPMPALTDEIVGYLPEGRPIVRTADGGVSTHRIVTEQLEPNGPFYNIPTMFGGKEVAREEAIALVRQRGGIDPDTGRPLTPYPTLDAALTAQRADHAQLEQHLAARGITGGLRERTRLTPAQQRMTQEGELPTGPLTLDTAPLQPAEATALADRFTEAGKEPTRQEVSFARSGAGILTGGIGALQGVALSPLALGILGEDSPAGRGLRKLAEPLQQAQQALQVQDPTTTDQVFQALGSQLSFLIPSLGVGKALQLGGRLVGSLGLGASAVNAVLEAGGEASEFYENMKDRLGIPEAQRRAQWIFWKNAALIALTDKLGMFHEGLKPGLRGVTGGVLEGFQERFQYNFQNQEMWLPGDTPGAERLLRYGWTRKGDRLVVPWKIEDARTAQIIGTVLGGVSGGVMGAMEGGGKSLLDVAQETRDTLTGLARTGADLLKQSPQVIRSALETVFPQQDVTATVEALKVPDTVLTPTGDTRHLPDTQVREGYGTDTVGGPLRVFHGTTAAFEQFDLTRTGTGAGGDLYGPGVYFTEDPAIASSYTERLTPPLRTFEATEGEAAQAYAREVGGEVTPVRVGGAIVSYKVDAGTAPNVRPAYLDIRQPFDVDATPSPALVRHVEDSIGERLDEPETNKDVYRALLERFETKEDVNDWLQANGYDGITHIGGRGDAPRHRVWIAFDPAQVIPAFSLQQALGPAPSILSHLRGERGSLDLRKLFGLGAMPEELQQPAAPLPFPAEDFPEQPSPPGPEHTVTIRAGAQGLTPETFRDENGRWRIPLKDMPSEELELQDFLRQPDAQGRKGVRLEGETDLPGELRALILQKETGVYGLQNNVSGLTFGQQAERAAEHGFIPTADKDLLKEALTNSLGGRPQYSYLATGRVDFISNPLVREAYQTIFDIADTFAARVTEQTRGEVRPHALVHQEAQELLASGTWTVDDVRDILPGTALNDTMAVVLIRHLSQLGRTLQAANIAYQNAGERIDSQEFQDLRKIIGLYGELSPARLGVLREAGRTVSAMNDPTSGMNWFLDQLDATLQKAPEQTMSKLSRAILKIADPDVLSKTLAKGGRNPSIFKELLYANLLSSFRTQLTMIFDNLYNGSMVIPDRAAAGIIGLRPGGEVQLAETPAMIAALPQAISHGMSRWWHTVRTGETMNASQNDVLRAMGHGGGKALTAERIGLDPQSPLGRYFDLWAEYIGFGTFGRLPQRFALAADELGKGFVTTLEVRASAAREAARLGLRGDDRTQFMVQYVSDPPADVVKDAENSASVRMLQATLGEGTIGRFMQQAQDLQADVFGLFKLPIGRLVIPFLQIGVNSLQTVVAHSPLAPASAQARAELFGGGAKTDLGFGKVLFGSMMLAGLAVYAGTGALLGRGPEDKELRAAGKWDERQYTWHPFGDWYIPYRRWGVLGMQMGMMADLVQVSGEVGLEWYSEMALRLYYAFSRNMMSQTYFEPLAKFFDAMSMKAGQKAESALEGAKRFAQSQIAMAVPQSLAAVARAMDPVKREYDTMMDQAYSKIPGWSGSLRPRRDLTANKKLLGWGMDMGWIGALGNAASPLELRQSKLEPWQQALVDEQVQISHPRETMFPSTPGPAGQEQLSGGPLTLSKDQYDKRIVFAAANRTELAKLGLEYDENALKLLTEQVEELTGDSAQGALFELNDALNFVVASDRYKEQPIGPEGGRGTMLQAVVTAYRQAGDAQLLATDEELRTKYYQAIEAKILRKTLPAYREQVKEQFQEHINQQLGVR